MNANTAQNLEYRIATFRTGGMEARWSRTRNGQPCILVRLPSAALKHQRETWWLVTQAMWNAMQRDGVREGFKQCTLLGDVFSVKI